MIRLSLTIVFAPLLLLAQASPQEQLIARANALELKTPYVPPPGDALDHYAAGYAKVLCSAVFITGLDPAFAAENLGYFVTPYSLRAKHFGAPEVDYVARSVTVRVPTGGTRTAKMFGSQGCITLPLGRGELHFTPSTVTSSLPDAKTQPWPIGDLLPATAAPPPGLDLAKVQQAVDAAFADPACMTAAFVVTHRGRLIGERYAQGITASTRLESWSMGKSLTATLLGILIGQGVYRLDQPAPVPEWQSPGDPRAKIRLADILNMSSGLRIRAPQDPDYDDAGPFPDHLYLYTGSENLFRYAATRTQQWPPGIVGRYRNTDPVLANYLIRLAVEKRGENYHAFPRRALLDKLGMRTMIMETDAYGNFLTQGYEYASARDWARLGNLYLQNGLWNGERILPADFVKFVQTLAPAWKADGRPVYGGFFWLNGDGRFAAPKEMYFMAGAGGQYTMILPSHDLVVVRQGHYKGQVKGEQALHEALRILLTAVPPKR